MSAYGRKRTFREPVKVNYAARIRCDNDGLFSAEHGMNAVTTTACRVAYGTGVAALLLNLYGCARERMYAQVEPTTEAAISAEDAEQIPIQDQGPREQAARPCVGPFGDSRTPGSRVVGCGPAEASRVLEGLRE